MAKYLANYFYLLPFQLKNQQNICWMIHTAILLTLYDGFE